MPIRYPFDGQYDGIRNRLGMGMGAGMAGFSPIDLLSLRVWIAARDASTITKDEFNNLSGWDDKSFIENNAGQLTGAAQPLWVDGVVNGLPVTRFDGAATFMTFDDNILSGTTGRTFFMVVRAAATGQDEAIVSLTNDNSNGARYDIIPTVVLRVASGNKTFNEDVVDATDFFILTIQNAANSDVDETVGWINGVAMTELSSGSEPINTGTDDVSAIGRSQLALTFRWFEGDLAELICCDEELSFTDRKSTESYLSNIYNIPLPVSSVFTPAFAPAFV